MCNYAIQKKKSKTTNPKEIGKQIILWKYGDFLLDHDKLFCYT